jgi:hypothetical protein
MVSTDNADKKGTLNPSPLKSKVKTVLTAVGTIQSSRHYSKNHYDKEKK